MCCQLSSTDDDRRQLITLGASTLVSYTTGGREAAIRAGYSAAARGVATGWTGVDMSTPLLPEVVREIDANPVSHGLLLDSTFVSVR